MKKIILFFILLGLPVTVQSAEAKGVLQGLVQDSTGGVIDGARVSITSAETGISLEATTDEVGVFLFSGVPDGVYAVEADFPGFQRSVVPSIVISIDQGPLLTITLEIGTVSSEAVVKAPTDSDSENKPVSPIILPVEEPPFVSGKQSELPLYFRGRFYADWFGGRYQNGSSHQLSNRLKLQFGSRPGDGWTLFLDLRNRHRLGERSGTLLSIYDARMTFDDLRKPVYLSVGQMNLYDTSGIGSLLGGVAGHRIGSRILLGGYGGLLPDLYGTKLDTNFQKYGGFLRYIGPRATNFALSFNELRYAGESERRFIYLSGLAPVSNYATLYGNLEYELANHVQQEDRLSRLFLNGRFDPTPRIDVIANYSSGRGLDFHRYLLERSQNPTANDAQLERFYYTNQYGVRLRYKLNELVRVHIGLRSSERKDVRIKNNTTQLGFSVADIAGTGISAYANYNLNRGDQSESNSLYASVSRTFGKVSWSGNYSNSFNGLRLDPLGQTPVFVHLDDLHTISNDFFIVLNRALALSFQHEHTFGRRGGEDLFFVRLVLRM